MNRWHWIAKSILVCCLVAVPTASARTVTLDLDLKDAAKTRQQVAGFKGQIVGGQFVAEGWKTTTRKDYILIPLPAGIDTREGSLTLWIKNFELTSQRQVFESWRLVSLDHNPQGVPNPKYPTGQSASLHMLYMSWTPAHPNDGPRFMGYFNLFDAGCTDWRKCTGEGRTKGGFLRNGVTHTLTHAWKGPSDKLTFAGNGTISKTIDLSATSPKGTLTSPQMYLLINTCGRSTHKSCGRWDPSDPKDPLYLRGGPIGVIYQRLRISLSAPCGDGLCSKGIENCHFCAQDCPCPQGRVCSSTSGSCVDPPPCGNGTCEPAKGENCSTCAKDCACAPRQRCAGAQCVADNTCGDGRCSASESCTSCPADCGCPQGQRCQADRCQTPPPEPPAADGSGTIEPSPAADGPTAIEPTPAADGPGSSEPPPAAEAPVQAEPGPDAHSPDAGQPDAGVHPVDTSGASRDERASEGIGEDTTRRGGCTCETNTPPPLTPAILGILLLLLVSRRRC